MIVKEMLDTISFDDLWQYKDLFINNKKEDRTEEQIQLTYETYKNAWRELLSLEPKEINPKMFLIAGEYYDALVFEYDNSIDQETVDIKTFPTLFTVSGFNIDDETSYSMILTEWEEVLGWRVSSYCLKEYGAVKIAAYLLYELTFFGLSYDEVNQERIRINEETEQFKEQLEEGTFEGSSWSDFLEEIPEETKQYLTARAVYKEDLIEQCTALNHDLEELIITNVRREYRGE